MAQKAVNDTAGPDVIVPTLSVFGAHLRISDLDSPAPSISKQANAVQKVTTELRHLQAKRQIKDALAMRNGPSTELKLNLPINSTMPQGPVNFRFTVVKPYYAEASAEKLATAFDSDLPLQSQARSISTTTEKIELPRRNLTRSRVLPKRFQNHFGSYSIDHDPETTLHSINLDMAYISNKEKTDFELAVKLRKNGIITSPGAPFEKSQSAEIEGLINCEVFEFVKFNPLQHSGLRIFKSRLVNEVKSKTTDAPYEKSRLVI
ncbi:hypothetical protein K3495_g10484 [Podosphaera aphanis]|nr:hypothetical protein K3495_g10484 [Podosphaera aphanis]